MAVRHDGLTIAGGIIATRGLGDGIIDDMRQRAGEVGPADVQPNAAVVVARPAMIDVVPGVMVPDRPLNADRSAQADAMLAELNRAGEAR